MNGFSHPGPLLAWNLLDTHLDGTRGQGGLFPVATTRPSKLGGFRKL